MLSTALTNLFFYYRNKRFVENDDEEEGWEKVDINLL